MSGHVGVSGAWKEIVSGTSVGVGGAWKAIEKMWIGVSGVWKQFYEALSIALDTEVDGADLGSNLVGYHEAIAGSMVDDDYVDGSSTTRTITAVYGDGGFDTVTYFALAGNSIPNTGDTFVAIESGGTFFYRADATYDGSDGTYSSWTWSNGIFVGGPGTHELRVYV